MRSRGFSVPIVIIFVAIFLAVPVVYLLFSKNSSNNVNVKGASAQIEVSKSGLGIYVSSQGTWDLFEYLCKDLDECANDLMTGNRWGTVSGGAVKDFRVSVPTDSDWGSSKYLKIFVREGWGSMQRSFNLNLINSEEGISEKSFTHGGSEFRVILIEIEKIKNKANDKATYSDL